MVGYGHRGRGTILPALIGIGRTPGWIVDTDPAARARAMRDVRELGLEEVVVTGDFSDVLAEVVVIAVPHNRHGELVSRCVDEGRKVLKEKPLAVSLSEAEALPIYSGGAPVRVLTTRNYRESWPLLVGLASQVQPVSYTYRSMRIADNYRTTWRNDPRAAGGGVILDLGYHVIDVVVRLFGPVVGADHASIPKSRPGYSVEEEVSLNLAHESGVAGRVTLSRIGPTLDESLLIQGSQGYVMASSSAIFGRIEDRVTMQSSIPDAKGDLTRSLLSALGGGVVADERSHDLAVMRCINDSYLSLPRISN